MTRVEEEKSSNCIFLILLVTFVFSMVAGSLSCLALYLNAHPERWTCDYRDNNKTSDFPINNEKATGQMNNNKTNSTGPMKNNDNSTKLPGPIFQKHELKTLGPKELNLRWCDDVNSKPYPLKAWNCVEGNSLQYTWYLELDPETIPTPTSKQTTNITELKITGPQELIERLCSTIATTPLIHKLPVIVYSLQLFWGLFLVVVCKCLRINHTKVDKTTLTFLQFSAYFKLLLIIENLVMYIYATKFATALSILMMLNSCVFLYLISNILAL